MRLYYLRFNYSPLKQILNYNLNKMININYIKMFEETKIINESHKKDKSHIEIVPFK